MRSYKIGDITTVTDGIIVQQVNAQGRMASGVAKAIRLEWPKVFTDYAAHVGPEFTQRNSGLEFMGQVVWSQVDTTIWVASVIGQQFFGKEKGRRYTCWHCA